ncbi:MAG: ribonuclease P protein component [Proteobacteria bacterium]|nr:ribonuclease P protein component [Pseudomonadota bacterium]
MFRAGRRYEGHYLQIVLAPGPQSPARVGYILARKQMPRAVDRNRLRRQIREMLRAHRSDFGASDVIVRVKRKVVRADLPAAALEAAALIGRVAAEAR